MASFSLHGSDAPAQRYRGSLRFPSTPAAVNLPARDRPEPRAQPAPAMTRGGYLRQEARPAPMRDELIRQPMQQPRYPLQQPPEALQRTEATRPPRGESRSERKPSPRDKNDGQQP